MQSEPHVGHVRSAVNFDVLRRWLAATGYDVDFIRNVTDIDDKILAKSAEQGVHWYALAAAMKRELDAALAAINVLPPTYEPGATGHVPEIVELIEQLIARGHAYAAEDGSGDVYFDVRSWAAYGELTRQKVEDMEPAGDADPRGKRDPRDFALWKGWKKETEPQTAAWPSPWGPGRPGWHIECSAMAGKYLGPAFDIHGGGVDLRFPHHENEQAQSRAAGPPVRVVLAAQRLDHHGRREDEQVARQLPAHPVGARAGARHRAALLHGGRALPLARRVQLRGARRGREGLPPDRGLPRPGRRCRRRPGSRRCPTPSGRRWTTTSARPPPSPSSTTRSARATGCSPTARPTTLSQKFGEVIAMLDVLGLNPADPAWATRRRSDDKLSAVVDALVQGLLAERTAAREAKDWARADAIRDQIAAAGIEVEDTPTGPKWSV